MSQFHGGPVPPQQPGPFQPQQPAPQFTPPKKKHTGRTVAIVIASVVVGLIVIGALAPNEPAKAPVEVTSKAGQTPVEIPTKTQTAPAPAETTQPPAPPKTTAPELTAGQEQAIGSAEEYLTSQAFSRKGLIHQLSSAYGAGFSTADATFAVDHITVDWNEQAARAADEYLATMHFSRAGLIQQLESAYGAQFTHAQAVYGVTKAGL